MLDITDKKYIDSTIERSHRKFQEDTERYLGMLMEEQKGRIEALQELVDLHPTREQVWDMIREDGRQREMETQVFKEEMAELRRDVNIHERRIGDLERLL